jgi:ribonuclease H2 subunit A
LIFVFFIVLVSTKINLNTISHDSAIGLIQSTVDLGYNISEVYVDTVGDPQKYQQKLSFIFPSINITVSKKADSLFPIVSAASVAAKVTRDLELENWTFKEEKKRKISKVLGSGYPGGKQQ